MGSWRNKPFSRIIICTFLFLLFMFIYILSPKLSTFNFQETTETPWQNNFCLSPLSETQVFDTSNIIEQHDCRLWNFIRENYLIEPSDKPYNLVHPNQDPSDAEGQNKIVLEILNYKKDGFFVECGAWDGEQLSATLRLERDFGWTGLLVEPNGESFSKLKLKNRKAWIVNLCLSPAIHPQMMDLVERPERGDGWFQGTTVLQKYRLHFNNDSINVERPCFPIFSVLSALNVTTVDFFLLDIEGAELDVLKTIPFDEILIKVFSMEYNLVPEGKEELLRFMESKGYKLAMDLKSSSATDFILVHESVPLPEKYQNAVMTPVV